MRALEVIEFAVHGGNILFGFFLGVALLWLLFVVSRRVAWFLIRGRIRVLNHNIDENLCSAKVAKIYIVAARREVPLLKALLKEEN